MFDDIYHVAELETLFVKSKPCSLLLALLEEEVSYAAPLTREVDSTYAHISSLINKLEDFGLVETQREGRIKLIRLTQKGRDLAGYLDKFIKNLRDIAHKKRVLSDRPEKDRILEKLQNIKGKIEEIKIELAKGVTSPQRNYKRLIRKLGAYKKQVKMIQPDEEDIKSTKNEIFDLIESILSIKRSETERFKTVTD